MSSDANHDNLIGEVLAGRYRIEALIGEGAMGAVYRARHVKVGRAFAIKVLHPRFSGEERTRKRFAREAEVAGTLHHPNVVSVIDVGDLTDGRLFLVMEYAEGITLLDLINETAPMSPPRVISLVRQLCNGLSHAHELGLIHRDFKPDNVIVERDRHGNETPRIVDFGTAILREDAESSSERLTTKGLVLGTPHYMSPEHATGQPIDHRIDLFALGVTCFEMMTGHSPFEGDGVDVARANLLQETPVMSVRVPGLLVDPLLEAFTRKLMMKSRDDRPASAAAARELIELIEQDRRAAAATLGVPFDEPRPGVVPSRMISQPIPLEVDVGDAMPMAGGAPMAGWNGGMPAPGPPMMAPGGMPGEAPSMGMGMGMMGMMPGAGVGMGPGIPAGMGAGFGPGMGGAGMMPGAIPPGTVPGTIPPAWHGQAPSPWQPPYGAPPQAWQPGVRAPSAPPYSDAGYPRFKAQPEATELMPPMRPMPWRLIIPGFAALAVLVTMVIAIRGHGQAKPSSNRVEYSSLGTGTAATEASAPHATTPPASVASAVPANAVPKNPPTSANAIAPAANSDAHASNDSNVTPSDVATPTTNATTNAPDTLPPTAIAAAEATPSRPATRPPRVAHTAHVDANEAGAQPKNPAAAARPPTLSPPPANHPITMPLSAAGVAELYASVGRQLKALDAARGSSATAGLWPLYLNIHINEVISDSNRLAEASTVLYRIEDQVSRRSAAPH